MVCTAPVFLVTAYRLVVGAVLGAPGEEESVAGLRGRTWSVYSLGGGIAGRVSRSGLPSSGSVDRDSCSINY